MESRINSRRKEHTTLFENTLSVIKQRVEAQLAGKDEPQKAKIEELYQQIIDQKKEIESMNNSIELYEKQIKECQIQYKEQVRLELGELNEIKT